MTWLQGSSTPWWWSLIIMSMSKFLWFIYFLWVYLDSSHISSDCIMDFNTFVLLTLTRVNVVSSQFSTSYLLWETDNNSHEGGRMKSHMLAVFMFTCSPATYFSCNDNFINEIGSTFRTSNPTIKGRASNWPKTCFYLRPFIPLFICCSLLLVQWWILHMYKYFISIYVHCPPDMIYITLNEWVYFTCWFGWHLQNCIITSLLVVIFHAKFHVTEHWQKWQISMDRYDDEKEDE